MIKNNFNPILLAVLLAFVIAVPVKAQAFSIERVLDPLCLVLCDNSPKTQNITNTNSNNVVTNSNNTNSNINSGTINAAPGTTASASTQGAVYAVSATPPAQTNIVNNNNSSATVSNPNPVVVQNTQPYYNQVYSTPTYYPQPTYYSQPTYYNPPTYYNTYNQGSIYYSPLTISCRVNATFAPAGTTVTWTAYANGGNGSYTYSWSGTDGMYGSYTSLNTHYNSPGVKYAAVTVYSNGQQMTAQCSNAVTVGIPTANYNNAYANQYVYQQPKVVQAPVKTVTVIKEVVREVAPVAVAPASVDKSSIAASMFSLQNVPWGLVGILVILILIGVIFYLIFNQRKM